MQKWNFILLGITGDLAKRKILPALGEFSGLYQSKVEINLIGYSRSIPDDEIKVSLGQNHKLNNISYIQGDYYSPDFFINYFKNNEKNIKTIIYFAVPPHTFLDLLETFCPFNTENLEIIIEKPFGRDGDEAIKILQKIQDCKLERNVHFCDHYLFKSSLDFAEFVNGDGGEAAAGKFFSLGKESRRGRLAKNPFSKNLQIQDIQLIAYEKVNVQGRGGYYDEIGAIKDMIPAHFYSILNLIFKNFSLNFANEIIKVEKVKLSQYPDYRKHVNNPDSKTETYFDIDIKLEKSGINVNLVSGKAMPEKLTELKIKFTNEKDLIINIDPERYLRYEDEKIILDSHLTFDHTQMFKDILDNNFSRFVSPEETISGWEFYLKIRPLALNNH